MRTLAIGDIHGCKTALETLASTVGFTKEDRIIFLGDHIDRGPDSKGVIDFLIGLQRDGFDVTCLKGNHEIMMLEAKNRGGEPQLSWIRFGGDETLNSYGAQTFLDVPDEHWKFLENLKPYKETENHIFVHAGANSDVEMSEQSEHVLHWVFFDFPVPHQSGKKVICGHSAQKNGRPLSVGHAICIDTFAHGGGWLTCIDVDTEFCWRANEKGEVSTDSLEVIANSESDW